MDDTGFPKKGRHSVGVARQYCGQLGKQDNCQVAVSLSVANDAGQPADRLPALSAGGLGRRSRPESQGGRTGGHRVPHQAGDRPRPGRAALAAGVPTGVVLADAGYGIDTGFRSALTEMGLTYIAGIQSSTSAWPPGRGPLPPKPWSGKGRPPSRSRRDPTHKPVSAKELAHGLLADAWQTVTWREGSAPLSSRFAAVRVRPANRDYGRSTPRPEEWLLIEWPQRESEPTKYWFSTAAREDIGLADFVNLAKLRWRIERDYQELKQEIGLGHYEGRGWRGFHHHAALAIAAYGYLVSERSPIPPSGSRWQPKLPRRAKGFRPRGSPHQAGTSRAQFDRDPAMADRRATHRDAPAMSLLPPIHGGSHHSRASHFMTQ